LAENIEADVIPCYLLDFGVERVAVARLRESGANKFVTINLETRQPTTSRKPPTTNTH
jgi:tRNA nucleotidyltransferase (CCA-adding enzyme)